MLFFTWRQSKGWGATSATFSSINYVKLQNNRAKCNNQISSDVTQESIHLKSAQRQNIFFINPDEGNKAHKATSAHFFCSSYCSSFSSGCRDKKFSGCSAFVIVFLEIIEKSASRKLLLNLVFKSLITTYHQLVRNGFNAAQFNLGI